MELKAQAVIERKVIKKKKIDPLSGKPRKIQCFECQGWFSHIQAECANTLKKQSKSYNASLTNEYENSSDSESEEEGDQIAFNAITDVSNDIITDDPLSIGEESDADEGLNESFEECFKNMQARLTAVVNIN